MSDYIIIDDKTTIKNMESSLGNGNGNISIIEKPYHQSEPNVWGMFRSKFIPGEDFVYEDINVLMYELNKKIVVGKEYLVKEPSYISPLLKKFSARKI